MKTIYKTAILASFVLSGISATVYAQAVPREYKQSFAATLSESQEVPPTGSTATGNAIFNVSMDEREIDFGVGTTGLSSMNDIILGCGHMGENGTTTVILTAVSTMASANSILTGTIKESDLQAGAAACSPNIFNVPHLVQAMREGAIYINVRTNAFPEGEIRGQLVDSSTSTLQFSGSATSTSNGGSAATSTATSTSSGSTGSDTATSTATSTSSGGTTATSTPDTSTSTTVISGSNGGGASTQNTSGGSSGGSGFMFPQNTGNTGGSGSTGSSTQQGEVLGASTSCTPYITSYIQLGDMNDTNEVLKLQSFLSQNLSMSIPSTGTYDMTTFNAVKTFQVKYKSEILDPWIPYGIDPTGTGYVYKTTTRWINMLQCPDMAIPMPQLP